jgi:hypothetical protein
VQGGGLVEAVHDVLGFGGGVGVRDEEQAGVIVDEVEDLRVLAAGELPVRDVGLPCLVWQVRLEANQRAAGSLLWLRHDQSLALEDPPDRRSGRHILDAAGEVVRDRRRAGVMAVRLQLAA